MVGARSLFLVLLEGLASQMIGGRATPVHHPHAVLAELVSRIQVVSALDLVYDASEDGRFVEVPDEKVTKFELGNRVRILFCELGVDEFYDVLLFYLRLAHAILIALLVPEGVDQVLAEHGALFNHSRGGYRPRL